MALPAKKKAGFCRLRGSNEIETIVVLNDPFTEQIVDAFRRMNSGILVPSSLIPMFREF